MIIISIPKSGTHLLSQALGYEHIDWINIPNGSEIYKPCPDKEAITALEKHKNKIALSHISYHPIYEKIIRDRELKSIFLYRDPRDLMISYYFWTKKSIDSGPGVPPLIEDVSIFINSDDPFMKMIPFWGEHIRRYVPWMFVPNILHISFESMIQNRERTFKEISEFLHCEFGSADEMISNINPKTSFTFRRGVVGEWKNYLNKKHLEKLDEVMGDTMKILGYENGL